MENEKRIILLSAVDNVLIENKLTHFQNSMYNRDYLNENSNHSITLRQLYIDLDFKNPICPKDNAFPSLICAPYVHILKNAPESKYIDDRCCGNRIEIDRDINLQLIHFHNVHKYYLNTAKKYTIKDLFEEWSVKELIAIESKKQFNELNGGELTPLYPDKDLIITSKLLKDTGHSIILGQHPIEEGYVFKENEKTILFFHYHFAEKLKIETKMDSFITIDGEKYYFFHPHRQNLETNPGIEISYDNPGLLFETPNILQVKCKNIANYPLNDSYCKTIGLIHVNEEMKYSGFHHCFTANEFYHLENNLNENFEILITDELDRRVKIYQGKPTLVEISVIEDKMNEKNIRGNSQISSIYPKNSPTEFKFDLPGPLELNEEWKCALSSITFKNDFKFDSNFHFLFSYYQYDGFDNEILSRRNVKIDHNAKSARDIFEAFKAAIEKHEDPESEYNGIKVGFVACRDEGIMTILFTKPTKFTLSPHLAMLLGVSTKSLDDSSINYQVESIEHNIGRNSNSFGGTFIGTRPVDFQFNLDEKFMFLESNILKEMPVGNGSGKILKIIPLSTQNPKAYTTVEFEKLDYHPLQYHHLQKIDFKLRSQSGSILQMRDSNAYNTTWVHLIFKRFARKRKQNTDLEMDSSKNQKML